MDTLGVVAHVWRHTYIYVCVICIVLLYMYIILHIYNRIEDDRNGRWAIVTVPPFYDLSYVHTCILTLFLCLFVFCVFCGAIVYVSHQVSSIYYNMSYDLMCVPF